MKNLSTNMRAIIFVLLSFLCFNIADAFLKAVVDDYHFGSVGFYPIVSYLFFLLIFSIKAGGLQSLRKTSHFKLHMLRGLFSTFGFIGFIIAITYITLAQTYTLILTSPFWVVIASVLIFKKRIGLHRGLAIIFGFIGVLVVLQPSTSGMHIASLGALVCALGASGSMMTAKVIGEKEPLINMIFFPLIVTILTMIVINSFWKGWQPITIEHAVFFVVAGATFLIADFLFVKGFMTGETDLLAPLHYSQILWGALIGYFVFAEEPEIWTIVGAIIIVLSGVYLIYREHITQKNK